MEKIISKLYTFNAFKDAKNRHFYNGEFPVWIPLNVFSEDRKERTLRNSLNYMLSDNLFEIGELNEVTEYGIRLSKEDFYIKMAKSLSNLLKAPQPDEAELRRRLEESREFYFDELGRRYDEDSNNPYTTLFSLFIWPDFYKEGSPGKKRFDEYKQILKEKIGWDGKIKKLGDIPIEVIYHKLENLSWYNIIKKQIPDVALVLEGKSDIDIPRIEGIAYNYIEQGCVQVGFNILRDIVEDRMTDPAVRFIVRFPREPKENEAILEKLKGKYSK